MRIILCNSENATSNYLAHDGVLGMKWGKRNGPPYPLNRAGRAAFKAQVKAQKALAKLEKKDKKQRKMEEEEQKRLEKKRETYNKRQAQLEKDKARIMRSAPAEELVKYNGIWTNEELKFISDRLRLEDDIKRYVKPPKTTIDKINKAAKAVDAIGEFNEKSIKLYNTIAKIYNANNEYQRKKNPKFKSIDLPIAGVKKESNRG